MTHKRENHGLTQCQIKWEVRYAGDESNDEVQGSAIIKGLDPRVFGPTKYSKILICVRCAVFYLALGWGFAEMPRFFFRKYPKVLEKYD